MNPPLVKDIYIKQNCLFVLLGEESAPAPAIENSLGDFVALIREPGERPLFKLDLTNVEDVRTLQFGKWTIVDSESYFALQFDDELAKELRSKRRVFKVSSEQHVFDVTFCIADKFGTKRVVMNLSPAKEEAVTLDMKSPNPLAMLFIRLGILLLRALYAIMKLFPQQNKYTFISKLSKKPPLDIRILSRYVSAHDESAKVVVLAKPMHPYIKYLPHMFKQMWHLATSKAVFLDRSCLVVHVLKHRENLRIVQMWHAIGPMKVFGCANIDTFEGQPHRLAELFHMHRGYTDILVSSMSFAGDFIEGFGLKYSEASDKLCEIPLPRCDFYRNEASVNAVKERLTNKYPELSEKKNILYCPTYRMGSDSIKRAHAGYEKLLRAIDGNKYNVIYSPHPLSRTEINDSKVVKVAGTTQEKLCVADIVISDYSTVIYEAGLLGKPIYLYCFDYENYQKDRRLNLDVKEELPLPFCEDASELARAIENRDYSEPRWQSYMDQVVKLPCDKSCCQLIYELVQS